MATIFETINSEGSVTATQARELGRMHAAGGIVAERVSNVYLRGLAGLVEGSAMWTADGLTHHAAEMYTAILEGVTTPDIAPTDTDDRDTRRAKALERNRRGNWARTVHSALRGFIVSGGAFSELPSPLTKGALIKATAARKLSVTTVLNSGAEVTLAAADGRSEANAAFNRLRRALRAMNAAGDNEGTHAAASRAVEKLTAEFLTPRA
jgi:hypothetical protein